MRYIQAEGWFDEKARERSRVHSEEEEQVPSGFERERSLSLSETSVHDSKSRFLVPAHAGFPLETEAPQERER